MKTKSSLRARQTLLGLVLPLIVGGTPLGAQTVATTPAPANAPAASTEVIELSPFTVSSSKDVGYRAENTLAGSRLNSSLKDTPGVLDVMTKDFLDDIGATTLEQALAFATNSAEDAGDFDSQGVINTIYPGSQINVTFRTRGLGVPAPTAANLIPSSYFIRTPRSWNLSAKFDF